MADVKISQLPAATTPVVGTEVLPIVQSGTTSQVSINAATGITRPFTANGVVYASSSSALATGSALVFDGTNFATTGTATATKLIPTGTSVTGNGMYLPAANSVGISTAGVNAVYIDASQNVGIGTSSPGSKLVVAAGRTTLSANNENFALQLNYGSTLNGPFLGSAGADIFVVSSSGGIERMRITAVGDVLVGGTSATNIAKVESFFDGSARCGFVSNDTTATANAAFFIASSNGTTIGSITRVGSTAAVIYNTASDYRLKTVIGPVADAGQRIDALQPVEYTWNADGSRTCGFLAHQFQEVYAASVTGAKDAVDAEGKPVYQAMQASSSEVIADLVAEIQSLRKRLTALEQK